MNHIEGQLTHKTHNAGPLPPVEPGPPHDDKLAFYRSFLYLSKRSVMRVCNPLRCRIGSVTK